MSAQRQALAGGRWHLQHGPIDVVIGADGAADALADAHQAAWQRFTTVLDELVSELPALRGAVQGDCPVQGAIARRMWAACAPYRASFITPMAAVAGAVAQELVASYARDGVRRAWVNNGGDVALHLSPGASLQGGLFAHLGRFDAQALASSVSGQLRTDADFAVHASLPVRGIATSGWRGRSFSMGIADSVTVLARTAAEADAAATVIANAVDVDAAGIVRRPACELKDDSDLGQRLVTTDVPILTAAQVEAALAAGRRRARELQAAGLIWSALLCCQGRYAAVGLQQPSPVRHPVGSVFAT